MGFRVGEELGFAVGSGVLIKGDLVGPAVGLELGLEVGSLVGDLVGTGPAGDVGTRDSVGEFVDAVVTGGVGLGVKVGF